MFHVKHLYIISMTPNMLYAIKKVVHGEPLQKPSECSKKYQNIKPENYI